MTKGEFFKRGFKNGIPIGLGYFAVSFSFGMMCVANGLSVFDSVLISLTNLTSAGQFAGLNIILANGTYIEMFLTQLVINLRYSLMSFSFLLVISSMVLLILSKFFFNFIKLLFR